MAKERKELAQAHNFKNTLPLNVFVRVCVCVCVGQLVENRGEAKETKQRGIIKKAYPLEKQQHRIGSEEEKPHAVLMPLARTLTVARLVDDQLLPW